jgi:hypothetical protein
VARAQRIEVTAPGIVLGFRPGNEAQERVRDAPTGGEHHTQGTGRKLLEDLSDALETLGVRDRRTAEFVYDPGGGVLSWH